MEPQRKYRRSGGININDSKVDTNNIAGRDIHNNINLPPEPEYDESKNVIKLSLINALASVGTWIFGILAFFSMALFSDTNSGLSCLGIILLVIFIVLAIFSYNVASNTKRQ
jgi:amino acid transporter